MSQLAVTPKRLHHRMTWFDVADLSVAALVQLG
jgi:hypothetical protein